MFLSISCCLRVCCALRCVLLSAVLFLWNSMAKSLTQELALRLHTSRHIQYLFLTTMLMVHSVPYSKSMQLQEAQWLTTGAASEGSTDCFELSWSAKEVPVPIQSTGRPQQLHLQQQVWDPAQEPHMYHWVPQRVHCIWLEVHHFSSGELFPAGRSPVSVLNEMHTNKTEWNASQCISMLLQKTGLNKKISFNERSVSQGNSYYKKIKFKLSYVTTAQ